MKQGSKHVHETPSQLETAIFQDEEQTKEKRSYNAPSIWKRGGRRKRKNKWPK
jgi:hypothetical protein